MKLAKMIGSWRRGFDDPTLPFIVVQLADFDGNTGIGWKRVQ